MWKNHARLVWGVALLGVGGYFLLGTADGWKKLVQKEWLVRPQKSVEKKSLSKEDEEILEGAKLHMYGPLASSVSETASEGENEIPAAAHTALPPGVDRVSRAELGGPRRLIHRKIKVSYAEGVGFVVPAHAIRPHVYGKFAASGGAGAVDIMLLNADEFNLFIHHRGGTASFAQEGLSTGEIDWTLQATYRDPQKYYLVFKNVAESENPTLVDANFMVSFE